MSTGYLSSEEHNPLSHPGFPRSSKYSSDWVFENQMGPNPLWLLEWLLHDLEITPGMRILDMGCGKALTSIFLANEFEAEVWANDLWIPAKENLVRINGAGMGSKVFPVYAEAHALPYAEGFFDAIVSIDSYHYYGTDDLYLGYIAKHLKTGGSIGIVVPGLYREFENGVPVHLMEKQRSGGVFWEWECCTFHTAAWWRNHWSRYPFFSLTRSEGMEGGGTLWLQWERALEASGVESLFPSDVEALEKDNDEYLTFVKVIGKRTEV